MKPRERIKRIRMSKSFEERSLLAGDYWPGTEFDPFFGQILWAKRFLDEGNPIKIYTLKDGTPFSHHDNAKDILFQCGKEFARVVEVGDSHTLRQIADAIDTIKRNPRSPDKLRRAIIGAFGTRQSIEKNDFENWLKQEGVKIEDNTRQINRICRELGYKVLSKPGRPRKSGDDLLTASRKPGAGKSKMQRRRKS